MILCGGLQLIGDTATAQVADILLPDESLESVGPWADTIRSNKSYNWAADLHFIDTPDWACVFDAVRGWLDNRIAMMRGFQCGCAAVLRTVDDAFRH